LNRTLRATACAGAILWLSACVQHYDHVQLRAGDVARTGEAMSAWRHHRICTREGEDLGYAFALQPVGDDDRGQPDDPAPSTYRLGPDSPPAVDRTPSPFLISGAAVTGTGVIMMAASGVNLFSCAGPEGCQIPGWAPPVGFTGLGIAVVGSVLLIIGGIDPDAGTSPRPYTITEHGEGHVCEP
jgi:hypothetical protein